MIRNSRTIKAMSRDELILILVGCRNDLNFIEIGSCAICLFVNSCLCESDSGSYFYNYSNEIENIELILY